MIRYGGCVTIEHSLCLCTEAAIIEEYSRHIKLQVNDYL